MSIKKTREEVAYEYLKSCGPCLITFDDGSEAKILLSADGEAFWLNDEAGPNVPYITLKEVLDEAKHLLLSLFTANMEENLTLDNIYQIENELRVSLADCVKRGEIDKSEVREIKIKFLDVKESILEGGDNPVVEDVKPVESKGGVKSASKERPVESPLQTSPESNSETASEKEEVPSDTKENVVSKDAVGSAEVGDDENPFA